MELLPRHVAKPAGTPVRFTCRYRSDRRHRIEFSDPQPEGRRWATNNLQYFNPAPNEGWAHGAYRDYPTVVTWFPRIVTCIVRSEDNGEILGTIGSKVVPLEGRHNWGRSPVNWLNFYGDDNGSTGHTNWTSQPRWTNQYNHTSHQPSYSRPGWFDTHQNRSSSQPRWPDRPRQPPYTGSDWLDTHYNQSNTSNRPSWPNRPSYPDNQYNRSNNLNYTSWYPNYQNSANWTRQQPYRSFGYPDSSWSRRGTYDGKNAYGKLRMDGYPGWIENPDGSWRRLGVQIKDEISGKLLC